MKKISIIVLAALVFSSSVLAQKEQPIVVKSGRDVKDYFPYKERYRYQEFLPGKAVFKSRVFSEARWNYNLLNDDMEFLRGKDTLAVNNNKNDISYIVIEADTFVYDNGFIEIISDGSVKVGIKKHFKLNELQKTDSYGIASAASSRESYGSMPVDGNYYKFRATTDMVFQKTTEYYLSRSFRDFVPYRKNYVLKLFPEKEDKIKGFLKSGKIDFDSEIDLIKLTSYLRTL
jgi:hypothetical protein